MSLVFLDASLLALGIAVRLISAALNYKANDAHYPVVRLAWIFLGSGEWQALRGCLECSQPKLFYIVTACVAKVLGVSPTLGNLELVCQFVSALSGSLLLVFLWRFLRLEASPSLFRSSILALLCLSPSLISISIQCTNDSLAILFGALATHRFMLFVANQRFNLLARALIWTCLGLLTKGSVLIVLIWICVVLPLLFLYGRLPRLSGRAIWGGLCAVILFLSLALSGFGGESKSSRLSLHVGDFVRPLIKRLSYLRWHDRVVGKRPGIRSISEGFFTFPFVSVVKSPWLGNSRAIKPRHRTSYWALLYGRTHWIFFPQWPWQLRSGFSDWLGRIHMMAGILPTLALIWGWARWGGSLLRPDPSFLAGMLLRRHRIAISGFMGVSLFVITGMLYAAAGRDFAYSKEIFLLPGLPLFVSALLSAPGEREGFEKILTLANLILAVCYAAGCGTLMTHLFLTRPAG